MITPRLPYLVGVVINKKENMSTRNQLLSARFLKFLQDERPAIRHEELDVQQGLAYLLSSSTSKQRVHSTKPGCIAISYQEIYERFGRKDGLEILTTRYNIFETTGEYSIKDSETRAFKVADDLAEGIKKHHRGWRYRPLTSRLIKSNGQELTEPLAAIDSLDNDGRRARAKGKTLVQNFVPVPVETMRKFHSALSRLTGKQLDLFAGDDIAEIENVQASIGQLMGNTMLHDGAIGLPHRYEESKAGRLYGQGMHLQNTRRTIKNIVLNGGWEYDISNCHYSILYQMAANHGLSLPAVGHYLCWKKEVRQQIMLDIGIDSDSAKTCLIALIYGARNGKRDAGANGEYPDAIPKAIGIEAAELLYVHPLWVGLKEDVSKARSLLIKQWPRSRARIENAMGKFIGETQSRPKILAHLLQGIESKMLEVIRTLYPHKINLLQHDGWASHERLDLKLMEDEIAAQTGFVMEIEEARLGIPANMGISK